MNKRKVLMVLEDYIKEDIIIDPKYSFEFYKDEYKVLWIDLLVKVNEFLDKESATKYFDETFLNKEETYKNMLFVLYEGNIVGTCSLWEGYHFGERRYRAHWMAVDPDHQGKRLAKALLHKIIQLYNNMGTNIPLYLSTSDQNIIAIIMYKSVGFKAVIQNDEDKENWKYIDNIINKKLNNIKLVVFDMDGTLLNDSKEVSSVTKNALHLLQENGYKLAIASGRSPLGLKLAKIKDIEFDYFVCSNGAIIVDNKDNIISQNEITDMEINEFVKDCEIDKTGLMYCFLDGNYSYVLHDYIEYMFRKVPNFDKLLFDNTKLKNRHEKESPFAGVIADYNENVEKYRLMYPNFSFLEFRKNEYDLFHKDSSKSAGLKILCDKLNMTLGNVMAFGDHYNDFEMIRDSKIGVAMKNSIEEIKNIADYVTDDNNNDGIAKALKYYGLI
ncbi:MAG: Cof-type HAD-IIB family hydrolase [Erysipelotrichaceae bacterium]|nr:Cof-type HAD-IIB family hydrolase [Erysipelotrichaceae bacterium]